MAEPRDYYADSLRNRRIREKVKCAFLMVASGPASGARSGCALSSFFRADMTGLPRSAWNVVAVGNSIEVVSLGDPPHACAQNGIPLAAFPCVLRSSLLKLEEPEALEFFMQVSPPTQTGNPGRCPRHPHEAVLDSCSRCGDYVCLECAHVEGGLVYCETCRPSKGTLPQADLGQRFFGNLFDQLMFWVPFAIGGLAKMQGAGIVILPLLMLTVNAYLLHHKGQSIGKVAMGSRIVTKDYGRAPLWRLLLLRFPIQAIGAVSGVSAIDAAFVLGSERRTLHDRAAGTRVVDANASEHLYL